jgi:hypothetical protein
VPKTYVIVGIWRNNTNVPEERLLEVTDGKLFKQVERLSHGLRSWPRRVLSLKHVAGFSRYECHPKEGYHSKDNPEPEIETKLAEMFWDYQSRGNESRDCESGDPGHRWLRYIHEDFNQKSSVPWEGKYALQLVLRWSPVRFIIWGTIPILLSLGIGGWYMHKKPEPGTNTDVIGTAWVISTYIISAGARTYSLCLRSDC